MLGSGTLMARCHLSTGEIRVEKTDGILTMSVMQDQESHQAARWRGECHDFFLIFNFIYRRC